MKTEDFNKCREFLEKSISESQDNNELIKAYVRLIELKSEYDKETDKALIEKELRQNESTLEYQAKIHTNNTNHNVAWNQLQAESYRNDQNLAHQTVQTFTNHIGPPTY